MVFLRVDVATVVILMGFSAVTIIGVRGLPMTSGGSGKLGPGLLPLVVGIGLGFLSLLLSIKLAYFKSTGGVTLAKERIAALTKPAVILLAVGGYVGLASLLGFFFSTLIFLFVCTRTFGEKSWLKIIIYSVILTSVLYLLFVTLLKISLPMLGAWGI